MEKADCDFWFVSRVLPHEAALTRYLRRAWRRPDEVEDLRQEIYVRVYNAALIYPPVSVRAFLFSTARNLLIDQARRQRIVSFEQISDIDSYSIPEDYNRLERQLHARSEVRLLEASLLSLPTRCREVFGFAKSRADPKRKQPIA